MFHGLPAREEYSSGPPGTAGESRAVVSDRLIRGQVVEAVGGVYRVRTTDGGTVEASLRGRIKHVGKRDRVVIGDYVDVGNASGEAPVIEAALPRRTSLSRRSSRSRFAKVVAANLDRLLVVASVADPPPSRSVIDRMLVMGEAGGMECRIVLNKVDLAGGGALAGDLGAAYRKAGYQVVSTSVVTGEGIDAFRTLIHSGSSVLAGPSGVGKSALLNAVEPGLALRTQAVGRRSRAGRHTTVSSRLITLAGGGRVADTPGFSDAGPGGVPVRDLGRCFPDFRPYLGDCQFNDCVHIHEPGCAVLSAVEEGRIEHARHKSYRTILAEL